MKLCFLLKEALPYGYNSGEFPDIFPTKKVKNKRLKNNK
jgi:hypothetical protein